LKNTGCKSVNKQNDCLLALFLSYFQETWKAWI